MKITLIDYPVIIIIPVEKLSLVGCEISAPRSTAMTTLGMLEKPKRKLSSSAMKPYLKDQKQRNITMVIIEAMHYEIKAFLYA
jgi:hypothetical protein